MNSCSRKNESTLEDFACEVTIPPSVMEAFEYDMKRKTESAHP